MKSKNKQRQTGMQYKKHFGIEYVKKVLRQFQFKQNKTKAFILFFYSYLKIL